MLMDRYRASSQGVAELRLVDLPRPIPNRHRVVLVHYPLRLNGEYPLQVASTRPSKCRPLLVGGHAELGVELPDIPLPQKGVRALQCSDPRQPEFLRQAPLPGSETTFRTSARLWRIRRDHLDSHLLHCTSN